MPRGRRRAVTLQAARQPGVRRSFLPRSSPFLLSRPRDPGSPSRSCRDPSSEAGSPSVPRAPARAAPSSPTSGAAEAPPPREAPGAARDHNSQKAPRAGPCAAAVARHVDRSPGHVAAALVTRTNTRPPRFPGRSGRRWPWPTCPRKCRGPAATWTTTRRPRCCGGRRGPGRQPARARRC